MGEPPVEIPNRALFKAAEVCEIARLQPYVLRSWQTEFPGLGVQKAGGTGRVYRRADLERVLRIKHLLLVDGLTLAGVRRRLETEETPVADGVPLDDLLGRHARERIVGVKKGLRSLLDMLSSRPADAPVIAAGEYELTAPATPGEPARAAVRKPAPAAASMASSRKASSTRRPARPAKPSKPAARGKRRGRASVN